MKRSYLLLPLLLFIGLCPSACRFVTSNDAGEDSVKLVHWQAAQCDSTYNPYYAVARISDVELKGTNTLMTVSFPDNCCAEFDPYIEFKKNKLIIEPYKIDTAGCDCNCYFSLVLTMKGLSNTRYEVVFKGKKVERSDDPYPAVEPRQEKYKDIVINRTNKYGFREGIWMSFFPNGQPSEIVKYPEHVHHPDRNAIYTKGYYLNGSLSYFERKDTVDAWFEDGELKTRFLKFVKGDTTFEYAVEKHDNGKLKNESLEKTYKYTFTSKFDPEYRAEGEKFSRVMKRSYYESGKREYLFGTDTSYNWYESGKIKRKEYEKGAIAYYETGSISERIFFWQQRGPDTLGDLEHSLYVEFYSNGSTSKVHYVRDEVFEDGVAVGLHYNWVWGIDKTLVQSPSNWKEALPWIKYPELRIP
jgi:hypothetical protein